MEEIASGAQNGADIAMKGAERAISLDIKAREEATRIAEVVSVIEKEIGLTVDNKRDLALLGETVGHIARFVETINGIAEQTNLLALNAAIEAARAGESGEEISASVESIAQSNQVTYNAVVSIKDEAQDSAHTAQSISESAAATAMSAQRLQALVSRFRLEQERSLVPLQGGRKASRARRILNAATFG